MRTLHRSARSTLAGWLHTALAGAGAPATPAVTLAVTGWLACMEEIVLAWLDEPTTDRRSLEELCERSFYQLVRAALDDEEQWLLLRERVTVRPPAPPAGEPPGAAGARGHQFPMPSNSASPGGCPPSASDCSAQITFPAGR
ncbi:hypothetical protein ACFQ60_07910 [Streptomyces zhihengii]